jgi:hypothetical protein
MGEAVLHQHIIVGYIPGGEPEFLNSRALGYIDPDFGNENTFQIRANDMHVTSLF